MGDEVMGWNSLSPTAAALAKAYQVPATKLTTRLRAVNRLMALPKMSHPRRL